MSKTPVPEERLSALNDKMNGSKVKYLALLRDVCADSASSDDLCAIIAEGFALSGKYVDIIDACEKETTEEGKVVYYLSPDDATYMAKTALAVGEIDKKVLKRYNYSLATH